MSPAPGAATFIPTAEVQRLLDAISRLPEGLRQVIADQQWAKLPLSVSETSFASAQPANTPLYVSEQTTQPELITSIVATAPAGGVGIVQLSWLKIPFAGVLNLSSLQLLLLPGDVRAVSSDTAGPLMLWLTGEQRPSTSVLAP